MDGTVTCLLVDDHEAVRAGTRARLRDVDWVDVVGEAGSAEAALAEIERSHPDIVLLDERMPGARGTQLTRQLAGQAGAPKVILYSGHLSPAGAEAALEAGAVGAVRKDSPLDIVVDALRAARDGGRYLDPTIAADVLVGADGPRLSAREVEVLKALADDGGNTAIATRLGISGETVKAHVSNILAKLGVSSRTEAVARGLRDGLIE